MKLYYIDFSGHCKIEAESTEDAVYKFWAGLNLPSLGTFDDQWQIDCVGPVDDEN